jgi:hypothetical protein
MHAMLCSSISLELSIEMTAQCRAFMELNALLINPLIVRRFRLPRNCAKGAGVGRTLIN